VGKANCQGCIPYRDSGKTGAFPQARNGVADIAGEGGYTPRTAAEPEAEVQPEAADL
jgi:hypothetical protein